MPGFFFPLIIDLCVTGEMPLTGLTTVWTCFVSNKRPKPTHTQTYQSGWIGGVSGALLTHWLLS